MLKKFASLGCLILFAVCGLDAAHARECRLKVILPVLDDLGNNWHPGSILPVDIKRVAPAGASFCASGGSCLPIQAHGSAALKLLNCGVGPALGDGDFRLVPSERKAGVSATSAMWSRQKASDRLSEMGFSNASVWGLADEYVRNPHPQEARLVAQALAGSKAALAALKRNNR